MPSSAVYLNVYDLIEHNDWTYWCGVGIFHSGVEVYGVEYAYGGHEYDAPGVFATNPRQAPGTVTFREPVLVGETDMTPREVYAMVQELGQIFRGNAYHLLQQNCNTFSDELCYRLTGQRAPPWVNRLANFAVSLHCLLPQGWVPPLRPPTAAQAEEQRLLAPGSADLDSSTLSPPSQQPFLVSAPQLVA
ncbi:DESI3 [Auxenochlorella protothecoides x Auxenochlorella symbiontica]|uniref:DeSI-like protein n=1 Tax=Auxenochlorella protothecoides TaxID=3075 RepID=A0A087SDF7_AUXPR|nr:DeSI-like protein [Auxenochlorella protothecoides]KFM23761.1 DeSI-like protein [Auxenochlorella protothecoides]RMZ53181.1 hypothetical protein APUTEX25_005170 [Auxenochlorella protothecoides]|eukprot:RMZ53181.1 hypothetical protein APUTEX25_005170 [Auxenochlorella protothecoides]